jgi:hypothetical protein
VYLLIYYSFFGIFLNCWYYYKDAFQLKTSFLRWMAKAAKAKALGIAL